MHFLCQINALYINQYNMLIFKVIFNCKRKLIEGIINKMYLIRNLYFYNVIILEQIRFPSSSLRSYVTLAIVLSSISIVITSYNLIYIQALF